MGTRSSCRSTRSPCSKPSKVPAIRDRALSSGVNALQERRAHCMQVPSARPDGQRVGTNPTFPSELLTLDSVGPMSDECHGAPRVRSSSAGIKGGALCRSDPRRVVSRRCDLTLRAMTSANYAVKRCSSDLWEVFKTLCPQECEFWWSDRERTRRMATDAISPEWREADRGRILFELRRGHARRCIEKWCRAVVEVEIILLLLVRVQFYDDVESVEKLPQF